MKIVKISILLAFIGIFAGIKSINAAKVKGVFVLKGMGPGWISWSCDDGHGWCFKKTGDGPISEGDEVILNHKRPDGKNIKVVLVDAPNLYVIHGNETNGEDEVNVSPTDQFTGVVVGSAGDE